MLANKRWAAYRAAKNAPPVIEHFASIDPLDATVLKQIQAIDKQMATCNAKDLPRFAQAKALLWNLVKPKAGVMRPRARPERRPMPSVVDTPQPVVSCGVVPEPQPNITTAQTEHTEPNQ